MEPGEPHRDMYKAPLLRVETPSVLQLSGDYSSLGRKLPEAGQWGWLWLGWGKKQDQRNKLWDRKKSPIDENEHPHVMRIHVTSRGPKRTQPQQ